MLGFPYQYGDSGPDSEYCSKCLRIALLACSGIGGILLFPNPAMAQNLTEILSKIEALEDATKACKKPSCGPISATACALSGACALRVKQSISLGQIPTAQAYFCGFVTSVCVQRVASSYNL